MDFTALEIAKKLNGTVEGDANVFINSLSKIEDAHAGSISFLSNSKYFHFLEKTKASAVIVSKNIKLSDRISTTLIRVDDAYAAFTQLLILWSESSAKKQVGIHKTAQVDPTAHLAEGVFLGAYVCVGPNSILEEGVQVHAHSVIGADVQIKKRTHLHPRVTLLDQTKIGAHCILHSGVVIGSDGFGFAPQGQNSYLKIPQIGNVIVHDHVEIGANTTIDRATLGSTVIQEGVKLDNLGQIAHNVEIGKNTVIAAQTGIAGSTKIGAHCVIGGQVGIAGHLTLGDGVQIQGQTGVIKNIPSGKAIQGTPAVEYKSYYKSYALFKRLPSIESRLSSLENNR